MPLPNFVITVLIAICFAPSMAFSQDAKSTDPQVVRKKQTIRTVDEMKERANTLMEMVNSAQDEIDQKQLDSMLGDPVQLTFLTGVIHDMQIADAIKVSSHGNDQVPEEGMLFVIIDFTLNNISMFTRNADMSGTMLIDDQGRTYSIRNKANDLLTMTNTSPSWVLTMAIAQPGVPIKSRMGFVIPEESAKGPLSLNLAGPYKSSVNVKLQKRDAEESSANPDESPAKWPIQLASWLDTKPARPSVGLNEPTDIGKNRYTIDKIEFLEKIGRRRGTATPESIFLAIDFTVDNLTNEQQKRFRPRLSVVDDHGRMFYPLTNFGSRPFDIAPKGNGTAQYFYLLPRAAQKGTIDLQIVNRNKPDESQTGWVRLKSAPAI